MPQIRLNISTEMKGVIFNSAKTKAAAKRLVIDLNDKLASEGVRRIKAHLGQVLRNPTGYYESQIDVQRRAVYRGVWDQNCVYGGWLEGVDPRNRTTRFKGYYTFMIISRTLQQDKDKLTQPIVDKFIAEMNK